MTNLYNEMSAKELWALNTKQMQQGNYIPGTATTGGELMRRTDTSPERIAEDQRTFEKAVHTDRRVNGG